MKTSLVIWALSLLFLAYAPAVAQSPGIEWIKHFNSPFEAETYDVAVDSSGNVYVVGGFNGALDFGGGTILNSSGWFDVYVAKYNASGALQWATHGSGGWYNYGISITADANGNCYLTGFFLGDLTFGNITLYSNATNYDVFLVKLNAAGIAQWFRKGTGPGYNGGTGIGIDQNGNSIITGYFTDSITFGNYTLVSPGAGKYDAFLAKYDSVGNELWAVQAGGNSDDYASNIAIDAYGNSYIGGAFKSNAYFENVMLTAGGSTDAFLAKYNSTGNLQWVKQGHALFGSAGIADLGLDAGTNIYATGSFNTQAMFGSVSVTDNGSADIFIVEFDSAGVEQWARLGGGASADNSEKIAVDAAGNCFVTGYFNSVATFGNHQISSAGLNDIFIARYNTDGTADWAKQAGGNENDRGTGIAVSNTGNCFATGIIVGNATFDNLTLTSAGYRNSFLLKLNGVTGINDALAESNLNLYPNPFSSSFYIMLRGTEPAEVTLYDIFGREVHKQIIVPTAADTQVQISPEANFTDGIYLLQVEQGGALRQARVIRQ